MSTVLPDGLLNISSKTFSNLADNGPYELRFLHLWSLGQFWRVSSLRNKFTGNAETRRAENLFWRLWNDPLHRESIDEKGVAELCTTCQQPFQLDPFELPMPSKHTFRNSISIYHDGDELHRTRSGGQPPLKHLEHDSVNIAPNQDTNDREIQTGANMVEAAQIEPAATSRPKASRSASSRNVLKTAILNPRDRPATTVSGASKAKRPVLGRRKNSSATSQYLKPPKSPGLGGKQIHRESTTAENHPHANATSMFELPSASSWEDESPDGSNNARQSTTEPHEMIGLEIDPDFRNKFSQKVASSSSLVLPGRMQKTGSVVRFAPETIEKFTAADESPDRRDPVTKKNERPLLFHRHSTNSVAVFDDNDAEDILPQLPRTKSQLSFLISERRATQGEESLDPKPGVQHKTKANSKTKKAEDEEILDMGRRQGVTKAGGIQVPRQHRIDRELESRYSSPDRDLIF